MNNAYTFDAVDNVLSVTNSVPVQSAGMGGQMSHTYSYDGLAGFCNGNLRRNKQ
jgi:hypothetical protein